MSSINCCENNNYHTNYAATSDESVAKFIIWTVLKTIEGEDSLQNIINQRHRLLDEAGIKTVACLKQVLERFSFIFDLNKDGYVKVVTKLKVCEANTRCTGDCNSLHICKYFALSNKCVNGPTCIFGHDIKTPHNQTVLQRYMMDHLEMDDLRVLLKRIESRTRVTRPQICIYYNIRTGCKNANCCNHLHICKYSVLNRCDYGQKCKRNHDLDNTLVTQILDRYAVERKDLSELIWENELSDDDRKLKMNDSSSRFIQSGKRKKSNYTYFNTQDLDGSNTKRKKSRYTGSTAVNNKQSQYWLGGKVSNSEKSEGEITDESCSDIFSKDDRKIVPYQQDFFPESLAYQKRFHRVSPTSSNSWKSDTQHSSFHTMHDRLQSSPGYEIQDSVNQNQGHPRRSGSDYFEEYDDNITGRSSHQQYPVIAMELGRRSSYDEGKYSPGTDRHNDIFGNNGLSTFKDDENFQDRSRSRFPQNIESHKSQRHRRRSYKEMDRSHSLNNRSTTQRNRENTSQDVENDWSSFKDSERNLQRSLSQRNQDRTDRTSPFSKTTKHESIDWERNRFYAPKSSRHKDRSYERYRDGSSYERYRDDNTYERYRDDRSYERYRGDRSYERYRDDITEMQACLDMRSPPESKTMDEINTNTVSSMKESSLCTNRSPPRERSQKVGIGEQYLYTGKRRWSRHTENTHDFIQRNVLRRKQRKTEDVDSHQTKTYNMENPDDLRHRIQSSKYEKKNTSEVDLKVTVKNLKEDDLDRKRFKYMNDFTDRKVMLNDCI